MKNKTTHVIVMIVATALALGLAACGDRQADQPLGSQDNAVRAEAPVPSPGKQAKSASIPVDVAFTPLRLACEKAQGYYDAFARECVCRAALFTTEGASPACAPLRYEEGTTGSDAIIAHVALSTGEIRTHRLALGSSGLTQRPDSGKKEVKNWLDRAPGLQGAYFRLAFREGQTLDFGRTSSFGLVNQARDRAAYADEERFLPLYLGMSMEEAAKTGAFVRHELDSFQYLEQAPQSHPERVAMMEAYSSLRARFSFDPSEVRVGEGGDADEGCARNCVASMPIALSTSAYSATFEKTYSYGLPAHRRIVIRDAQSQEVVLVAALSPLHTLSLVHEFQVFGGELHQVSMDRHWDLIDLQAYPAESVTDRLELAN